MTIWCSYANNEAVASGWPTMSAGLPWFLISPLLANFQKQRHVFQRGAGIQLRDREMWASACACGLIDANRSVKARRLFGLR